MRRHGWLKDRKDPAKAIEWWPTASYVSCDGSLAVNTGGWKRPDGAVGYFSTVWQRQQDGGWKWIVDGGDDLKVERSHPRELKPEIASCVGKPQAPPIIGYLEGPSTTVTSKDGTIAYHWHVIEDGSRTFRVLGWNAEELVPLIDDEIPAK